MSITPDVNAREISINDWVRVELLVTKLRGRTNAPEEHNVYSYGFIILA